MASPEKTPIKQRLRNMKLRCKTPQLVKQLNRTKRVRTVIRNISKNAVKRPAKRSADDLDHTTDPDPSPKKIKRRAAKRSARQLSPVIEVKRPRGNIRGRGASTADDWLDFPIHHLVKLEHESSEGEDMSVVYGASTAITDDSFMDDVDTSLRDIDYSEVADSLNITTPRPTKPAYAIKPVYTVAEIPRVPAARRRIFGDFSTLGYRLTLLAFFMRFLGGSFHRTSDSFLSILADYCFCSVEKMTCMCLIRFVTIERRIFLA
ncbi:unnamed protein product [Oikopleura dioica]|uniref:Uncharacterized protein n=1 Tax=Oikopleura dioica TaxID=34765 RepID=E4XUY5_OIKDI|nr:unnamed protein product [Oikopleura dioica]